MARTVRVVVEITTREVSLSLTDEAGTRVEHERFRVETGFPDILPASVGRDVFNLLYQCASDGLHGESDGMPCGK